MYSNETINGSLLSRDTWALSSSSELVIEPCAAFTHSKALIIQATSPAERRWKHWAKEHSARMYVMDVWTKAEVHALLYAFFATLLIFELKLLY
jgi:hypothetical protein